jgi:hypothetical protein
MSKIDVAQTVRDLEAGKTPEWISEHLRIYRESGGSERGGAQTRSLNAPPDSCRE